PLGLAYHNYVDYRVCGAEFARVPPDAARGAPSRDDARVGPHAGYFAVDLYSLKQGPYKYFKRFRPIAKAGYSIFIYHITEKQAEEAGRLSQAAGRNCPYCWIHPVVLGLILCRRAKLMRAARLSDRLPRAVWTLQRRPDLPGGEFLLANAAQLALS